MRQLTLSLFDKGEKPEFGRCTVSVSSELKCGKLVSFLTFCLLTLRKLMKLSASIQLEAEHKLNL